jgi:hypothetical protein
VERLKSTPDMEQGLKIAQSKGLIVPRTENNQYLKVSYCGAGGLVSPKWNIKIYTSGSVVCNDEGTLQSLLDGKITTPDKKLQLLQIDDSGWGFPLCGVMVGVTDGSWVATGVVDVSYFKPGIFERRTYLSAYYSEGMNLIYNEFHATTSTHRIEICTGFVNSLLRDQLRLAGFDVRVVEITGLLQDTLEKLFKEYVRDTLGVDLAYDPKELPSKSNISQHYYKALEWGKKNAPHMLKSGWNSIGAQGKI